MIKDVQCIDLILYYSGFYGFSWPMLHFNERKNNEIPLLMLLEITSHSELLYCINILYIIGWYFPMLTVIVNN